MKALYFSHDANATEDPKIIALIDKYGMAGYGRFWTVVEALRSSEDFRLKVSPAYNLTALARKLRLSVEEAGTFLAFCCDAEQCGLFEQNGDGSLWSPSLSRRMEHMEEVSRIRSEMGRRGGKASGKIRKEEAIAKQLLSKDEAIVKQNEANKQTKFVREKTAPDDAFPPTKRGICPECGEEWVGTPFCRKCLWDQG